MVLTNFYLGDFLSPQSGIYLSQDKGESWYRSGSLASGNNLGRTDITQLKYNPKDSRIMYLSTLGGSVLKSVDGGNVWNNLEDKNKVLSPRADIYSVAVDYTLPNYQKKQPDRFYVAAYQENYGHIFKTEDGGLSFKDVYVAIKPNYAVFDVAIDPRKPNVIWAATGEGLLLKSQDYGETWQLAQEFGGILNSVIINPNNPGQMFVSSYSNGIFTSFDGGLTWTDESEGLNNFPSARSVEKAIRDPYSGDIYLCTWFGVLKSRDGGINWEEINLVFPSDALPVLNVTFGKNSQDVYVSAKNYIYHTEDGGKFWKVRKLGAAKSVLSLLADPQNPNRVWAGLGNFVRR